MDIKLLQVKQKTEKDIWLEFVGNEKEVLHRQWQENKIL